jgi:serine/threonine-protein kinase
MTPLDRDRWALLEPLIDQAFDLTLEDRKSWLDRLRATSPDVAGEIDALLARESGPRAAWLDADPAALVGHTPRLAGQTIGAYTLDEPIGAGGMGSVWLAHRNDGRFEGKVALKLLNLALIARAAEQRFVQEGTVLARLRHPNVAALLDAGVSDAGQPYLVLEYVDGERIDAHADQHRLDPRQRIALCLDVARAAAHAHANLVIHRDIKPSNVLVTRDGTVKLLDFGIAKLVSERESGSLPSTLTEEGGRALTPEYAAPEVILGQPVSTATDVYSLGVLLFVLLAGRHPFGTSFESPATAVAAAVGGDPLRLSDAVVADAGTRSTSSRRLRRLYAGDLDNILAKSLKRKPEERYQTAAAFAEDLTRYLGNLPVAARPDSWGYRARKFARRHRAGLAAASVVALSLVGGTGFSVRQMRIAEGQRDRARESARRSAASVSFEATLFRVLERGRSYTYEELLERARGAVERQFRGDPIARMQIGIQFAQIYLRADDAKSAFAMLDRTREIADSLGHPEWQGRTRCELAASLTKAGRADSAIAIVQQGRRFLDGVADPERGTLNACDTIGADAWVNLNKLDSAGPAFERVAQRFRTEGDTVREAYIFALMDLSRVQFGLRHLREAGATVARLLELSRRGISSDPHTRAILIQNSATVRHQLGEFRASRELLAAVVGDSTGRDSVVARVPVLRYQYAFALERTGVADSAHYWIERALAQERDLLPGDLATAHTFAAEIAATRGDMIAFERHRVAVERMVDRLPTKAVRELGYLKLLAMRETGDSLGSRITAVLDSSGFGPGRPNQGRLVDHLLVAAERLNAAGRHADAQRYAEALVAVAAIDSLTWKQSGLVGVALYHRARGEIGRGDVRAARASLQSADAPLRYGYGPALRDSLGR